MTLRVDLESDFDRAVIETVKTVRDGGVVLTPTDTVYGFGCCMAQPSLQKLIEIKQRDEEKGFLILLPDRTVADNILGTLSQVFHRLAEAFWPGPVTFLVSDGTAFPALLVGRSGKVGLRVPSMPFLAGVLGELQAPLVSTSANMSGSPVIAEPDELPVEVLGALDLIVDGGRLPGLASTVLDLTAEPPVVLRRGESADFVDSVLESLFRL